MFTFIREHIRIIFIPVLVIILIVLGYYHVKWNQYVRETFDPVLEVLNEHGTPEVYSGHRQLRSYFYRQWNNGDYNFNVSVPKNLYFGGHIDIKTKDIPYREDGNIWMPIDGITIKYWPWDDLIVLGLPFTEEPQLAGASQTHTFGAAVDKNGQPLGRASGDSVEDYTKWLEKYELHYDRIMEMFRVMRELFGEDIFG